MRLMRAKGNSEISRTRCAESRIHGWKKQLLTGAEGLSDAEPREDAFEDRQGVDPSRIESLPPGVRVAAGPRGRFVLVHRSRPRGSSRGRDDCRGNVGGDVREVKA